MRQGPHASRQPTLAPFGIAVYPSTATVYVTDSYLPRSILSGTGS
jgi:hypothetical protein